MYLRTLSLHGFKSFADPTEVDFDPGITAIVGPNGCGKSNIVDAVRWAIGEQRPTVLRSEKMQNVIFNGTDSRKPLGMAEVQLTIENNRNVLPTEYSEVTIGRRLFRDGTSEYLMNDTTCRLKDITDLFMDTGMGADAYSVIELKMIDEIVSGSTEDRRRMFEEAAGITRYKMRRRQALRKLDNTQDDLERIRDLTGEIGAQVKRLKKQAEKAARHKELSEELHTVELQLAQAEYDRLQAQRAEIVAEQEAAQMRADTLDEKHDAAEEKHATLRSTLDEREAERSSRRQALQDHRTQISELESDQRLQRERLTRARDDRREAETAQERDADRLSDINERLQQVDAQLSEARPARASAESALEDAAERRAQAEAEAETLREDLASVRARLNKHETEQSKRQRTLDQQTNRLDLLREAQEHAKEQQAELAANASERAEHAQSARSEMNSAEADLAAAEEDLEHARQAFDARKEALASVEAAYQDAQRRRDAAATEVELLEGLVSSYDEFSDAIQHLASEGPFDDLITVADVLGCDDELRVALDAALGDWASCVVVASSEAAETAIETLRADEAGQATFIVLDRLPAPPEPRPTPNGTVSLRTQVRTTEPRYRPLADVLLHQHFVADDLDAARSAAEDTSQNTTVYAPTGEWCDAQGRLRGGSRQENASPVASRVGRREQLAAAQAEWEDAHAECETLKAEYNGAQSDLQRAETELEDARQSVTEAQRTFDRAEARYEQATYEREAAEERRDELAHRIAERADELDALRSNIETLRAEVQDAKETLETLREERQIAETKLGKAAQAERDAVEAHNSAQLQAVEARNRVDTLERDQERLQEQRAEVDARMSDREARIEQLGSTIETALDRQTELDEKIEAAREARADYQQAVDEAVEAVEATRTQVNEIEQTLRSLRQERESAVEKENKAAVRRAQIDTRLEELHANIEEDFDHDLDKEAVDLPEDFDVDDARSTVRSLRGSRNRLGDVNPLAVDEYAETKERLDFLVDQQEDLEEAEETLLETITEINTKASERFEDTYESIRSSFRKLFSDLFGEAAQADLMLEDADDPLDAPIEIRAKPPGKEPSSLKQLSSGEKTLTAIALLFAIYLVKPSPFCILDEVDAPLDDTNVERFMSLIRRFEHDTQFILVTHNQRTMALADRMYGVTMQENGVSELVGVEFDEAVEMAG
ncbi:MAG: chromosome segregation protein SMC [Longimonas sp.]|uniref:chromosome segregation protein SMC n=1 Tax=Longimonas sp. TaxID=2039626 RepID=UPI0033609DBF